MCYTRILPAGVVCAVLLAGSCVRHSALADTVWQWTDTHGQIHFSDTPPAQASAPPRQIEFDKQSHGPAEGLRPGERQALRRLQRRRNRQLQQALAARRRNDQAMAVQRSTCLASREQLGSTREREQRKRLSGYLRKHCW